MAKFRLPFPDKVERLPGDDYECVGPSLTKQSEAEACDINKIMARYVKTGVIDHIRENPGQFQDLPMQLEYQDAVALVTGAEAAFAVMPAEIRAQFENSPLKFLRFADENPDFLVKLGIEQPPEPPVTPAPAPAAANPPSAPVAAAVAATLAK